ncbi:MAG: transaldolase family protein, partial [Oscillospiraceae bacterium]
MMELLLDTANLEELAFGLSAFPICGITSNPTILKREGGVDLYAHLKKIKALAGARSLHVQVVSEKTADIVEEAHCILDRLGADTYIKIPVSQEGVPAIKALAKEGVKITATAIYTTMQGILALLS